MANLTQIGSAFGRTLESVNRQQMSISIFPVLKQRRSAMWSDVDIKNVIAACSEGYPFPTNLDRDSPLKRRAPQSQADLVWKALCDGESVDQLKKTLNDLAERQQTDRI